METSNTADVVLSAFCKAVSRFTLPSRVRGDRGGENLKVAVYMVRRRGLNRASYMFGSSTRNTRIERVWGEVGSQLARRWRGFFQRLERMYDLNQENPHHLWLLTELFLDDLRKDCAMFVQQYNHHGIRGEGRNQTPEVSTLCVVVSQDDKHKLQDMYLLGQLQHGAYVEQDARDDWIDEDPHQLCALYGVDETPRQEDSGHSESSEEETEDARDVDLTGALEASIVDIVGEDPAPAEEDIVERVRRQLHHRPAPVPRIQDPFTERSLDKAFFWKTLARAAAQNILPSGYGLIAGEEGFGEWSSLEKVIVGKRRRGREYKVTLSREIWEVRVKVWVQGMEGLAHMT